MSSSPYLSPLKPEQLRWTCSVGQLSFSSTEEVESAHEFIGQDTAKNALLFGLQCDAPGQNIYVRGERGTGRLRLIESLIRRLSPTTNKKLDYCYVHHFSRPDHPRLISLPPGTAKQFKRQVEEVIEFVESGLSKNLEGEPHASVRSRIQNEAQETIRKIMDPLEKDLAEAGMALVSVQQGPAPQTVIVPLVDEKPVSPDQLRTLVAQGQADPQQLENYEASVDKFQQQLRESGKKAAEIYREGKKKIQEATETAIQEMMSAVTSPIVETFPFDPVKQYAKEITENIIDFFLTDFGDEEPSVNFRALYGVNVVLSHDDPTSCPVVRECTPTLMNLLGTVEPKFGPRGMAISDYQGVRAGALLNANHGFLILEVNDLISEPGAFRSLMRTLRTGRLEIVPPEAGWMSQYVVTQPEAIPVKVRVILIGDARTYYLLDRNDGDFRDLFKVLADFESELPRDEGGIQQYTNIVAHLVAEESLPHFHADAIGSLVEHGARVAAKSRKLTARFGRIADIAREAAFLCRNENPDSGESNRLVREQHVVEAIRRTKSRADLPSRRFQEFVENGTILLQTKGAVVGQVNGLAVMHSGPLTYGFPARITATIGPGRAGLINIEGRAQMSGSIHTKGFHILGGLLRFLLNTDHPLAFSASLAFEQSYGGIDGDSASGAEIVCLLSALTGIPVKQEYSMTGAIDQVGHLEAIGGVNEKIEGFFDACNHFGLTGNQGVVIPLANAGDLMLRRDIVEAAAQGNFHIHATDSIYDAIELMLGVPAGKPDENGNYPPDTVLGKAVEKAEEFWKLTMSGPERLTRVVSDEKPVQETPDQAEPDADPRPE